METAGVVVKLGFPKQEWEQINTIRNGMPPSSFPREKVKRKTEKGEVGDCAGVGSVVCGGSWGGNKYAYIR